MESPGVADRLRTAARWSAEIAVTALAFKLAADFSASYAESFGASYLFPPAAVVFAAGAAWGWRGVAGVLVGSLFSRWGAASTSLGVVLFSLVHAATAAVPAWALRRPEGSSAVRIVRAVLGGIFGAFALSALGGSLVLTGLGFLRPEPGAWAANLSRWWTADVTAAMVLGLPVLLLLRMRALLDGRDRQLLRESWADRRSWGAALLLVALSAMISEVCSGLGWQFPYWVAVPLIGPIGLGALAGGLGAALTAQLAVSVVYFLLFLGAIETTGTEASFEVVGPVYLVQVFFVAFALAGGLMSGHNRHLLDRVRRQERLLRRDFERIVDVLAAAVEAKDPTTEGHIQRVAVLAVETGRRLGLSEQELEIVRYGALLHDVGKIGVPESVLNKPGPLTVAEREVIESHVAIGVRIVAGIDILQEVVPLVQFHQERWDGRTSGVRYPGYHGLAGEAIPVGARILAAVDAYDAITQDRPYREGRPPAAAVAELLEEAGRQFDPRVVEALVAVVEGELGVDDLAARYEAPGGEIEAGGTAVS